MIKLGVGIFPNPTGKQAPAFHSGWSATDPGGFVWIEDASADLLLEMPPALADILFEIDCFPVELSAPSPQRLTLFANGQFMGARLLRQRTTLTFHLPREVVTTRQLRLSLLPGMVEIPKLAGRNSDERALSVGVFSVCLRSAT
ncbi:hypothetical protein [Crenalkalicoccus roseus]|uniref:hypothetical protein n=1 Tax=Crenalkalicoccus roseus TaxID=1485588 RepID=UPI001080556A|nr:hypothetical protein [Crenalkalicoccus roseus]